MFGTAALCWRGLSRDRYGRRIAVVFPFLTAMLLGHRAIALHLHTPAEHILIDDMVLFTGLFGIFALLDEAWVAVLASYFALTAIAGACFPQRAPLFIGLQGLLSTATIFVRLFLDRHLSPHSALKITKSSDGDVGS